MRQLKRGQVMISKKKTLVENQSSNSAGCINVIYNMLKKEQ